MTRRKSGNGTSARQWLYTVFNPLPAIITAMFLLAIGAPWQVNLIASPFLILTKIGIGGNKARRHRQISKSSPGPDISGPGIRIWGAYQIEQFTHRCLSPFRVEWFGTGKTEWFAGLWGWVGFVVYFIIQKL